MALQINNYGELTIKIPPEKNQEEINQFLDKKKQWIINKLKTVEDQQIQPRRKEFFSGEKLLYNGRRYRLKVMKTNTKKPKLQLKQGTFYLEISTNHQEETIRNEVTNWYIQKAKDHLIPRIKKYANEYNVNIDNVYIKETKKQLGRKQR